MNRAYSIESDTAEQRKAAWVRYVAKLACLPVDVIELQASNLYERGYTAFDAADEINESRYV